ALVAAAADEMHANAADVGGNNIPVTGGAYNPDGATVADVLSTAVATPAVAAAPAAASAAQAPALPAPSMAASLATTPATAPAAHSGADDAAQGEHVAFHQHQMDTHVFAHLWHHA